MAPAVDIASVTPPAESDIKSKVQNTSSSALIRNPYKYSGSLDEYRRVEVTPVIGSEFPEVQLTDILNDDNKVRDLAITGKAN